MLQHEPCQAKEVGESMSKNHGPEYERTHLNWRKKIGGSRPRVS